MTRRAARIVLGATAVVLLTPAEAHAQPQVPATFFGDITFAGEPPANADLRAFIGEVDCTQIGPGQRLLIDGATAKYVVHVLHESQRPGCGKPGAEVRFRVDGVEASGVGKWSAGPNELNLRLPGATPPVRTPSPAATASQTGSPSSGGTATPTATPGGGGSTPTPAPSPTANAATATGGGVVAASRPSPAEPLPAVTLGQPEPNEPGSRGRTVTVTVAVGAAALVAAALASWRIRKGSFRA